MTEKIYDEQVAPLLLRACKICEEHKLPFVANVELADDSFGTTQYPGESPSFAMRLVSWAVQCKGNLDLLIIKVSRHNGSRKHNSIVLDILDERTFRTKHEN